MGTARLLDVRVGQLETGVAAPPGKRGALSLPAGVGGVAVRAWALAGPAAFMAQAPRVDCMLTPGD